jgi:hypothetical protein
MPESLANATLLERVFPETVPLIAGADGKSVTEAKCESTNLMLDSESLSPNDAEPETKVPAQVVDRAHLVPKYKLYTGAEIPALGLGTFGSDHCSHERVREAVK